VACSFQCILLSFNFFHPLKTPAAAAEEEEGRGGKEE
jgi:hypothetical protein